LINERNPYDDWSNKKQGGIQDREGGRAAGFKRRVSVISGRM